MTDYRPQKARVSKGLGEFPFKGGGKVYFEGLLNELNPAIMFQCLVCPPDEHPEDLWCMWKRGFRVNEIFIIQEKIEGGFENGQP